MQCKEVSTLSELIVGRLRRSKFPNLCPDYTQAIFEEVVRPDLRDAFADSHEADFSMSISGVGRFRVNAYQARNTIGLAFRHVAAVPYSLDELGLPVVIRDLAPAPRGSVLVTRPAAAGNTTTLPAMRVV